MTSNGLIVGVVGLGIIGSAIARNLAAAGWVTVGFDTDPSRNAAATRDGVAIAPSIAALGDRADLVLTSLPNDAALAAVVDGLLAAQPRRGRILAELSTLSLETKIAQQSRLQAAGFAVLDSPVSGTGAQAATRDIVLYASGDHDGFERARGAFAAFARDAIFLGAFGNGTRMKLVANLLVAIHNVAAAEAINLAIRAGLDPASLVDVLGGGAGGSRMLQVRGPLMVSETFDPPTMKLDVWKKDMALIDQFARQTGAATPLFTATRSLYEAATANGGGRDTAAVYEIVKSAPRAS